MKTAVLLLMRARRWVQWNGDGLMAVMLNNRTERVTGSCSNDAGDLNVRHEYSVR